ncbi:CPBP family intramembrane glutamic endopeptidase [Micromonospora echinofusca]|uniref:CPBP family intramembrane metalloprotease n=1 Tax=Micromonospora echinofusca TaxID=47858 RepID=A0ABS3VRD8_MICEH|nr:CPBP family intramembrane glutamic endopeptidase [Micromonospora echinofusca]MBO4207106.1 CPBP family intramembrane metalloprotease [Micromonospora echinofusca]
MRSLVGYVLSAYLFSWAWWVPMALAGVVVEPGQGWPSHLPGLLGPALAAVLWTWLDGGRSGLVGLWARVVRWRIGTVWWALIVVTAGLAVLPLLLGTGVDAGDVSVFSGAPAVGLAVVVPYVLLVNGFGEEVGWRGFLVERLLAIRSPLVTALLVWVVWAGWHLPLFWIVGNFRDLGAGGVAGWLVGLLAGSVLLTWLYRSAAHSVLIVAAWHTAFNFATATRAAAGVAAAAVSTLVMVAAVVVVLLPSFRRRPGASD